MVAAAVSYAVYVVIILSRAGGHPLTRTPYALAAVLGGITRVIAYRKPFPQW
jgi:hypothetical protein